MMEVVIAVIAGDKVLAEAAIAGGLGVSAVKGVEDPPSSAPLRTVGRGRHTLWRSACGRGVLFSLGCELWLLS